MKKTLLALLAGLLALGACSSANEPTTTETSASPVSKTPGGPVEKAEPDPEPVAEETFDDPEIFRAAMEIVLAEIPEADRLDLCSIVEGPGGVDLAVAGLRAGFESENSAIPFHDDIATEVVTDWCEADAPESSEYGDFNGNGFTYDDGLSVSVDGLAPYEPSATAAYFEMPEYVQFTVTIQNGTDTPYDPVGFFATLSSGGGEGDQVFDYEGGFNGSPMTPILPGASASFPIAFGVNDSSDLVLQATLDWDHEPSLFVGGL